METAYLLLFGKLPTKSALEKFSQDLSVHRKVKYRITDLMKCLPEHGHTMDALQAAVAALGMFYPAKDVLNSQVQYSSVVRLVAKLPTIMAAFVRLRRGDDHITAQGGSRTRGQFSLHAHGKVPEPMMADTGRLPDPPCRTHHECFHIQRTGNGFYSLRCLYRGVFGYRNADGSSPRRGQRGSGEMLKEIGTVANARTYIRRSLAAHEKIMGLGHREYKVKDPGR